MGQTGPESTEQSTAASWRGGAAAGLLHWCDWGHETTVGGSAELQESGEQGEIKDSDHSPCLYGTGEFIG